MRRLASSRLPVIIPLAILVPAVALLLLLWAGGSRAQGVLDDEIVYTDASGFIRVYDYESVANTPTIGWVSPESGYTHVTLIDSNQDGDMEIAGLRPGPEGKTILDIYDPVISPDEDQGNDTINGIPWRRVATLFIDGVGTFIAAGELYKSTDGVRDELLVGTYLNGDPGQSRVQMLRNISGNGTRWDSIILAIPPKPWTEAVLGDMDGNPNGFDEIGLLTKSWATVEIWRIGGTANVNKIYENVNVERPWNAIAMGDWLGNGRMMLGAVRDAPPPFPTLVLFRLQAEDQIEDYHAEVFSPGPEDIWFGDGNGTLDDEVFLLRSLPSTDTVRYRLFSRNRGSDTFPELRDVLDTDNGYKIGTAGDFDGDGRDEVAVLRNNTMRLYLTPETNSTGTNVTISSNTENATAGDLDRQGFVQTVEMRAIADGITPSLPAGGAGVTDTVEIVNGTNAIAIPIVASVEDSPPWVSISADRSTTPARLTFTYDASRLRPGTYRATLIVTAQMGGVSNNPLRQEIVLNVTNGLLAEPNALLFANSACASAPDEVQNLQLIAAAGTTYQASLIAGQNMQEAQFAPAEANVVWPSSVPWLSATSPAGIAPEAMTLTASFEDTPDTFSQAGVVLFGTLNGRTLTRTVAVFRLCVTSQSWLPLLMR